RLVTYGRKLGVDKPVMADLAETTVDVMGSAYPELESNRAFIVQVLTSEEERFAATLRQGLGLLEHAIADRRDAVVHPQAIQATTSIEEPKVLAGDVAFKLHDTYGFPLELTVELAAEASLTVDTDAFAQLMEDQRRRARAAQKRGGEDPAIREIALVAGPTEFLGYERLSADGRVVGIDAEGTQSEIAGEGTEVRVV